MEGDLSSYRERIGKLLREVRYCKETPDEERQRIIRGLKCPSRAVELFQYRPCDRGFGAGD